MDKQAGSADKQARREAWYAKEVVRIRAGRALQRDSWRQGYEDAISDLVEMGRTNSAQMLRMKLRESQ
jgi:hypothetical protein